jgi:hypothetical protein
MTETKAHFPADRDALRGEVWVRVAVLAWFAVMLAFMAAHLPVPATLALAVVLVLCAMAAFPPALLAALSGHEPLLTLTPEGVIYRLHSAHNTPWADIAEMTVEINSEEAPNKARPARRLPRQDRLRLPLKPDAARGLRLFGPRAMVIRPAYLGADLEAVITAIEAHAGREVVRVERTLPPAGP